MKIVVKGVELKEKMMDAISILCDTVKTTLGPKGSNAIISHSAFSPFITNDGVTIAENIESDDIIINTILEIAKEASIKTNENVGDGTTTTLVLLQSIFESGLKLIENGVNPIVLKKELHEGLEIVINKIKENSRIPSKKELLNIACVSANDKEIGKIINDAYLKAQDKSAVVIKEGKDTTIVVNYLKGYILETNLASNYFLKDLKEMNFENAYILLINNYLNSINDIANILNEIIVNNRNLVILAEDYSELVINEIVSLNIDNKLNIVLVKNPEYGVRQISILKDIAAISKAKIIEKLDYISMNDVGIIKNIKITKDKIFMNYEESDVLERTLEIKNEAKLASDEMELEFCKKRLSMFNNGSVEILVGDKTVTARREKKMRFDDALCAISSAHYGIIPGSGIILLKISDEIESISSGMKILKDALKVPFKQIMYNAGIDYNEVIAEVETSNYNLIYNVNTQEYENILNTEIVDSTDVVINSLTSAVSIASMLLTTTSIVINEHQNNLNKINDYNEL